MADGWRAAAFTNLSCPGWPTADGILAATPSLNALMADSRTISFDRAFVARPICTPSRASLQTGRYVDGHDARGIGKRFSSKVPTIAKVLRAHGWQTSFVGKWHIAGETCPANNLPGDASHAERCALQQASEPPERHGFERWAQDACLPVLGIANQSFSSEELMWMYSACLLTDGGNLAPTAATYEPTYYTDYFLQELRHLALGEAHAPYFAMLSLRPPHPAFRAPRWAEDGVRAQLPRLAEPPVDERQTVGYFGSIAALDREFGRVLAAIDEQPSVRERVVVFTSDHGWILGGRGHQGKGEPFLEAVHVPLLIRVPWRPATPLAAPLHWPRVTSNVDVAPTILGIAGIAASELCASCNMSCADGIDLSADLRMCVQLGRCPTSAAELQYSTWTRDHVRVGGLDYSGTPIERRRKYASSVWFGVLSERFEAFIWPSEAWWPRVYHWQEGSDSLRGGDALVQEATSMLQGAMHRAAGDRAGLHYCLEHW